MAGRVWPPPVHLRTIPRVGDMFHAKGGNKRTGTYFWLVVSVNDNRVVHSLGITANGRINSSTSYGIHAFWDRRLVVRVRDLGKYINDCASRSISGGGN